MASFRTKFQIFGLLVPDKNKYNPFLRQQAWHCARPVLCSKKNINEDRYDDDKQPAPAISKGSECYGKRKKMRFLNFRRILSTKTEKRSRIINRKTQKLLEQKLTFWEYVFGPKKSLSDLYRLTQKQAHRKGNLRNQATTGNIVINTEQVRSSKNPKNLEPQSSSMYKVPRAVLLNRMIIDDFYEKNNNCEGKTITFTMIKKPYDEMKPPSNFRRVIDLRKDVRSENNDESVPQMLTQISAAKARDFTAKISNQAMKQKKPRRHSRFEQLEILMNEKISEFKRASQINPDSENSNR
ncbi:uncharacterized protein [Polyergus mexicanus]|uniref:uncharacterized protein n=1 Tax=Polyergus mexicanus TaxID=615972 RepID=UPI0038B65C0C